MMASCFNPRPREGATCAVPALWNGRACFNPRPREGATSYPDAAALGISVSIHAPVKGRRC